MKKVKLDAAHAGKRKAPTVEERLRALDEHFRRRNPNVYQRLVGGGR